jgi:hypothetical protein
MSAAMYYFYVDTTDERFPNRKMFVVFLARENGIVSESLFNDICYFDALPKLLRAES